MSVNRGMMTSNRDDWETPTDLFEQLNMIYRFTLDPCSNGNNAKVANHFTVQDDGLSQDWSGRVFVNPPYGRAIGDWIAKCHESAKDCECVVALIPSRTDTKWFHEHVLHKASILFVKGRLKFETDGVPGQSAPFPSLLAVYDKGMAGILRLAKLEQALGVMACNFH